jgi:hypothetical protein
VKATAHGYVLAAGTPHRALDDLLAANPDLDRGDQAAELHALDQALAFVPAGRFDVAQLLRWRKWEVAHGIVRQPPNVSKMFDFSDQRHSQLSGARSGN